MFRDLAISTRELSIAVVPMTIIFISVVFWFPSAVSYISQIGILFGLVILGVIYPLGVVLHSSTNVFVRTHVRKFLIKIYPDYIEGIRRFWSVDDYVKLKETVDDLLKSEFPSYDTGPLTEKTYFLVRLLEAKSPEIAREMGRLISLDNLCFAIILPLLFASCSITLKASAYFIFHGLSFFELAGSILVVIVCIILVPICAIAGDKYRHALALQSAQHYLILRRANRDE